MEIDSISTTSFEIEAGDRAIESLSKIPKGLGSVPDSLHVPVRAPKPHIAVRIAYSVCLVAFQMTLWTIRSISWAFRSMFGDHPKVLYEELHQIALDKDEAKIREFFSEHAGKTMPAAFLFSEFVDIPEFYPHLPEILKGANLSLTGDQGFFCRRWKEHPDCYKRLSSHNYQGDECYAIDHLLFWVDPEGNTRLQFENSEWRGFFHAIDHIVDFFRYRRDNEQQGVTGASAFTEDFPLRIGVDLPQFLSRKFR